MNKTYEKRLGFSTTGIIIAALVVLVVAVFFMFNFKKQAPIKIGAILSLSGPAAVTGQEVKDGLILAVDEINAWGGINGRDLKLIIEDSKTNPQEGQQAFKKIEKIHKPLLYFSVLSSVSMALAPMAAENEVVLLGLVVTTPTFTEQNKWAFKYWPSAEAEVPPILSILHDLKVKNLGIIYINDDFGRSIFPLAKEAFERTGGTVTSESFESNVTDYKKQIAKLKDKEAIYIVGFPFHVMNLLRQLKQADFKGFILGATTVTGINIRSMPEANGVYAAGPIIYNPNFLFSKEVKEKYEARYNRPFTHRVANGYDIIKLLAGLLEDKNVSRVGLKTALEEGFLYSGVFGDLEVAPGKHDMSFPLHPVRIVDGKVKYLR